MDEDNPSYCGIVGVTCATMSFLLALGGNFWCDFGSQHVVFSAPDHPDLAEVTTTVTSGIWNYLKFKAIMSTDGESFHVTTYRTCEEYGNNVTMDRLWHASMAFTIIATVCAGVLAIMSCCVVCVSPSSRSLAVLAVFGLFAALFQGLVFLYFPSVGCQSGPSSITQDGFTVNAVWSPCVATNAANMGIAAIVFWVACALSLGYVAQQAMDMETEARLAEERSASWDPLLTSPARY